jgi:hypothetical protein
MTRSSGSAGTGPPGVAEGALVAPRGSAGGPRFPVGSVHRGMDLADGDVDRAVQEIRPRRPNWPPPPPDAQPGATSRTAPPRHSPRQHAHPGPVSRTRARRSWAYTTDRSPTVICCHLVLVAPVWEAQRCTRIGSVDGLGWWVPYGPVMAQGLGSRARRGHGQGFRTACDKHVCRCQLEDGWERHDQPEFSNADSSRCVPPHDCCAD